MPDSIEELTLPALTIPTSALLYNKLLKKVSTDDQPLFCLRLGDRLYLNHPV